MAQLIATDKQKAVVGLGATGLSVARYLARQQTPFALIDSRETPPNLAAVKAEFPSVPLHCGALSLDLFTGIDEIILSPGVALSTPVIAQAQAAGITIVGDIELFARVAKAPIVAITGSNAKSTVTSLVGDMAEAAGLNVGVGGNLGLPALDLLNAERDLYVLELSSFQLETTRELGAKVAALLNVSADHMDRYDSLMAYHRAKQRVYYGAENYVVNRADVLTNPPMTEQSQVVSFGLNKPDFKQFGIISETGEEFLAYQFSALMPVAEIKLAGRHNLENILAALAIGQTAGLPMEAMLTAVRSFRGLPHRCQWVAEIEGVDYFNDSKGTNVGATVAALEGLARDYGKLVLIAGGEGKGADFSELKTALTGTARAVIVFGRDAGQIAVVAEPVVPVIYADSLASAVELATEQAEAGDAVVLSPACASFDMFRSFEDRGEQFMQLVESSAQASVDNGEVSP